jgi:hypothetical protein
MFREYRSLDYLLEIIHTIYAAGGVVDLPTIIVLAKKKFDRDIPHEYMVKTVRKLVKSNVLKSSPLGYELYGDPATIKLGAVLRHYTISTEDQSLYKLEQLICSKLDEVSIKDYFTDVN